MKPVSRLPLTARAPRRHDDGGRTKGAQHESTHAVDPNAGERVGSATNDLLTRALSTAVTPFVVPRAEQLVRMYNATEAASENESGWMRGTQYLLHSTHLVLETAELAHVFTGAAIGGVIGNGLVGAGMTALGISHIVDGVREHSGEQIMEGTGALLLGARSGLEAVVMGAENAHGVVATLAEEARETLAPLGVAYGAAEAILGTKRVVDGILDKDRPKTLAGLLTMGLGTSICAASLGAGVPAVATASILLAARVVIEERRAMFQARAATREAARPEVRPALPPATPPEKHD